MTVHYHQLRRQSGQGARGANTANKRNRFKARTGFQKPQWIDELEGGVRIRIKMQAGNHPHPILRCDTEHFTFRTMPEQHLRLELAKRLDCDPIFVQQVSTRGKYLHFHIRNLSARYVAQKCILSRWL